MAKRPDYTPEKPFSAEQLSEIGRNFAIVERAKSPDGVCGSVGTMQAGPRWKTAEGGAYPGIGASVAAVGEGNAISSESINMRLGLLSGNQRCDFDGLHHHPFHCFSTD